MLKMKTMPAVVKPAETVSSMVNFLAIATAAIAYEIVKSRGIKWNGLRRSMYLHRLYRERNSKGYPGEYIPETGKYESCGKRNRVVNCESYH